uniref:(northern house mosquito) hypothetical protein n=1 Tax=Culex pipiens TaxID=7175 RepID=A0A8D8IAD4_CULPI
MTHSLAPASESCFSLAPLPGTASAALSHPSCESYKINPKIKTKPHNQNSLPTHQLVWKGTSSQKLASIRESRRPSPTAGYTEPEPEDVVLYGDAHLHGHKPGRQFTGLEHGGSKLTRSAKNEQTGRPKLSNEETKQSLMKLSRTCISNQNKINFKCFPHHFE